MMKIPNGTSTTVRDSSQFQFEQPSGYTLEDLPSHGQIMQEPDLFPVGRNEGGKFHMDTAGHDFQSHNNSGETTTPSDAVSSSTGGRDMQAMQQKGQKVATLWVAIGEIDIDEKSCLSISFDWNPECKAEIERVKDEFNSRLKSGIVDVVDDEGQIHTLSKPIQDEAVCALANALARKLKNLILAIPIKPSALRRTLAKK
jgi:hypothetical protein